MNESELKISDRNVYMILALVTLILYGRSLSWDFVIDDVLIIQENYRMRSLGFIADFFKNGAWHSAPDIGGILKERPHDYYRPLHMTFLALIGTLLGIKPVIYHAINLILNVANSILVYRFIKVLVPKVATFYALIGVLLFALHPVHVEPVNWICGGTDLLLTLLLTSSFLLYHRFSEEGKNWCGAASLLLFIIALFVKEVAVVFPAIVIGYDLLVARKLRMVPWVLFAGVVVPFLALRSAALGAGNFATLQFSTHAAYKAIGYLAGYVRYMFWPWPLGLHPWILQFGIGTILFALAVVAVTLVFACRDRRYLFCLLWFFVFLAPTLSLPFAKILDQFLFADRYLYLPSVAFSALVAYALSHFKVNRAVVMAGGMAVFAVMAVVTINGGRAWRSGEDIFVQSWRAHPDSWDMYAVEGEKFEQQGNYAKAIEYFSEAKYSNDPKVQADSLARTGRAYAEQGDMAKSAQSFNKALSIDPKCISALLGLGIFATDYETSLRYFQRAYEIDPTDQTACENLVSLNEHYGKLAEAEKYRVMCKSSLKAKAR